MIKDAWQRVRGLGLMRNDLRGEQDRLAAERIAKQAEIARRQQQGMSKRSRASFF